MNLIDLPLNRESDRNVSKELEFFTLNTLYNKNVGLVSDYFPHNLFVLCFIFKYRRKIKSFYDLYLPLIIDAFLMGKVI